jgi:deoxycytidine triphosphate deaminase
MKLLERLKRKYPRLFIRNGLLAYNDLKILIEQGLIDVPLDFLNGTSVDLTLHHKIMVEAIHGLPGIDRTLFPYGQYVDLHKGETVSFIPMDIQGSTWTMAPGSNVLGATVEYIRLPPWISAEFSMKSSHGRSYLDHQLAAWFDATFEGTGTLELKNNNQYHHLIITPGMKIGQLKFFKHCSVPKQHSYAKRGQYQGQSEVRPSGGAK